MILPDKPDMEHLYHSGDSRVSLSFFFFFFFLFFFQHLEAYDHILWEQFNFFQYREKIHSAIVTYFLRFYFIARDFCSISLGISPYPWYRGSQDTAINSFYI